MWIWQFHARVGLSSSPGNSREAADQSLGVAIEKARKVIVVGEIEVTDYMAK